GAPIGGAVASCLLVGLVANVALRLGPVSTAAALPRLAPVALLAGLATAVLMRAAGLAVRERVLLAGLVAAGVAAHGAVAFFPDHSPPDLDIHVRRTLDLFGLPFDYASLLRYGSQLPTASQDQGAATAALGAH